VWFGFAEEWTVDDGWQTPHVGLNVGCALALSVTSRVPKAIRATTNARMSAGARRPRCACTFPMHLLWSIARIDYVETLYRESSVHAT